MSCTAPVYDADGPSRCGAPTHTSSDYCDLHLLVYSIELDPTVKIKER